MENITIDETAIVTARREYYKKWRAANKDKVRQHNRNYWAKKAALAAEQSNGGNNDEHNDNE